MANSQLSVRLPEGLMQQLDAAAASMGSRSQLVIDILDAHFNPGKRMRWANYGGGWKWWSGS